ncbi:MAG: lipase family protein [Gordonia sp. (in: high G+C Gram-positive bacteria)]
MITIARRPRWVRARARWATAILVVAVVLFVATSVVGFAHAAPAPTGTTTPSTAMRGPNDPGTVYANRPIPGSQLIAGAAQGYQYTFWSAAADGEPRRATASLYLPAATAPARGHPILVWAPAARGLAARCAPSVNPTDADRAALRTWLARGYAVVITDAAGLGMPGAPQYDDVGTTARTLVNAVRASRDIAADLAPRWAVAGAGQGASAALMVATQRSGLRAPGLDLRGVTATSIPAEFAAVLGRLGPSVTTPLPAGWITEALYTLAAVRIAHPEVGLDDHLTPAGRSWLAKAAEVCAAELTPAVADLRLASLFTRPLRTNRRLMTVLDAASTLPARGFARPVLMTQSVRDTTVVVPLTLAYLHAARAGNRRVTARTYLTADTAQAARSADTDRDRFLQTVLR